MQSAWFAIVTLSGVACWMAYCAVRARIWRLGFLFSAGVLCFFGTFVPAGLYQFSHDASLKWVAAAFFAGAGVLMAVGWALNVRGRLASLAGLVILAFAGLLIQALRLVLPPSYVILTCVLSAIALTLIVLALRYDHFFKRGNSETE
jgi:hypothetical protein